MVRGYLKKVEIIVRERCNMVVEDEIKKDCCSTIGWKCLYNDIPYGDYITFNKPTLTVAEVVETTNVLLQQMVLCLEAVDEEEQK